MFLSAFKLIFVLAILCTCAGRAAQAADYPDYATFGVGAYDFDKHPARRQSLDYRMEYAWGISLLPLIADTLTSVEPFLQVHPTIGFEGNARGVAYGEGGLNFDISFLHHGIVTWGESVGAFGSGGDSRTMGSIMEFRSQIELGWQFENDWRLTGYISHISNAHITNLNPGAEIAGIYVHVPVEAMGKW